MVIAYSRGEIQKYILNGYVFYTFQLHTNLLTIILIVMFMYVQLIPGLWPITWSLPEKVALPMVDTNVNKEEIATNKTWKIVIVVLYTLV